MILLMCFSTNTRFVKYISTLTNHLRWLTLRAGVIKAKWGPGYKAFSHENGLTFSEIVGHFSGNGLHWALDVDVAFPRDDPWVYAQYPPKQPLIKWRELLGGISQF